MKRVRIPAGNIYSVRATSGNVTPGASGIVGFAVAGSAIVGVSGNVGKDAKLVNCLITVQSDPLSQNAKAYLVKRPGWAALNTPQSGSIGNQILVWTGQGSGDKVITAFGATNSSIYDGTTRLTTNAADTTAITGKATSITETFVSSTATIVISSSDNTAWYYQDAGTVTKITDTDFPGNAALTLAGGFVHMDGYAAILTTDGRLWASDLNSVTAWTATSYDSANASPDKGVAAVRHRNTILTFGTESMQVWYNAGTTPFPFAKSVAQTVKIGAVSADAIGQISDNVFWVGSTPQGGLSVYRYDGQPTRISTPDIDAQLVVAGASSIYVTTVRFYGRSFVLVVAGSQTFVFCLEDQAWHEWQTDTILWHKCAGVSSGSTMSQYAISVTSTAGKVFQISPTAFVYTDNGTAYTAKAQTAPIDFGNEARKFFPELVVIADTEASSSPVTLSYTDDDYQTWKTWGTIDLSSSRKVARRLGSARRRAFTLTHSANTPFRIEALELLVEGGQS